MKKLFGVSILSTMLILGQPFMVFADTTSSKIINFGDIKSIIAEQNIDVQINKNSSQKDKVDLLEINKNIRDLENELEDIDDERDQAGSYAYLLGTQKAALLDMLKEAERGAVDRPTLEAAIDLQNLMSDDSITRTAESIFISYNQLNSGISTISSNIKIMEKKLDAMKLQESLGIISPNSMNDFNTSLANMYTQLESTKFQQNSLERQFKNLLNEQDDTSEIGSILATKDDFSVEDEEADLKKAQENNYAIKLLELQVITKQAALDRAKKDHGAWSTEYKKANYDLTNTNLKLAQLKDTLKTSYNTMLDDIAKTQSELRLAEQILEDKKVALSEAQVRKGVGMISQLEMDEATTNYQLQVDAAITKQIDLFNAKCNYEWFLKGMA